MLPTYLKPQNSGRCNHVAKSRGRGYRSQAFWNQLEDGVTWKLDQRSHREFKRNPLSVVVMQIRFHPILKVAAKIDDFQELVRQQFPAFNQRMIRRVAVSKEEAIEVHDEKGFIFSSSDGSETVTLDVASLAVETKEYTNHTDFLAKAKIAVDAFQSVYGPVSTTRLGLRYVNIVKKEQIEKGLGRNLQWSDFVKDSFLQVPSQLDLENTRFACEHSSSLAQGGTLTLRHGIMSNPSDGEHFRFDVDRYQEGEFELGRTTSILEGYSEDLYSLFESMVGPALLEWMEQENEG